MLTLLVLIAAGIALLLACDGVIHLVDRWTDRPCDRVFRSADVRWIPPIRRSRRQRRALRNLPITSPEETRPW